VLLAHLPRPTREALLRRHFERYTDSTITEVTALIDEVNRDGAAYDRIAQLSVRTESGVIGTIVQDVVTQPAEKWLRLEGVRGYLEWQVNATPNHDLARLVVDGQTVHEAMVEKTRPDDFRGEIAHLGDLLADPALGSPLDFQTGMDTMQVIVAALASSSQGRRVAVEY
jgi:predicted dehydrogenase